MSSIISKAEFARLAGVSPAAISKACSSRLRPALTPGGIDMDHPTAMAYLARRRREPIHGKASGGADLADFVKSGLKTLRMLKAELPDGYATRLKRIDMKLVWLGIFSRTAAPAEQTAAMQFVRDEFEALGGLVE